MAQKRKWLKKLWFSICILLGCVCVLAVGGCLASTLVIGHFLKQGGYVVEEWEDGKDGLAVFNIPYGEGERRQYNLYLPTPALEGEYCPLLLFLHGGAWTSGRKEDIDYACRYFARHNCITVTAGYSLISEEHPEILISTVMDDIGKCIASVRGQLETRGIPIFPNRRRETLSQFRARILPRHKITLAQPAAAGTGKATTQVPSRLLYSKWDPNGSVHEIIVDNVHLLYI